MTGESFSEADLLPSDDELQARRRATVERAAAAAAVVAVGLWIGGLVALGACAAPFVFQLTPAPYSGDAMGAAFGRFDSIALGAAVVALAAEVLRTWAAGPRGRTLAARIRRLVAIAMAGCAAYVAVVSTPQIYALHKDGARRGIGEAGQELDRIHKRAELVGKTELAGGVALIVLHVFTLGAKRPDDDDDVPAPLAPGPRKA